MTLQKAELALIQIVPSLHLHGDLKCYLFWQMYVFLSFFVNRFQISLKDKVNGSHTDRNMAASTSAESKLYLKVTSSQTGLLKSKSKQQIISFPSFVFFEFTFLPGLLCTINWWTIKSGFDLNCSLLYSILGLEAPDLRFVSCAFGKNVVFLPMELNCPELSWRNYLHMCNTDYLNRFDRPKHTLSRNFWQEFSFWALSLLNMNINLWNSAKDHIHPIFLLNVFLFHSNFRVKSL